MNNLRNLLFIIALLSPIAATADFHQGLIALLNRDYETAMKMFKPLADKGNAAAQVNVGNLYMKGLGVDSNYTLARHWYLKAAEQGERMAQSKLGIIYFYGLGVEKNPTEAFNWFQKAAEQGDSSAQTTLASLYASGEGVLINKAMAFYWYTMAEEQGNKEAARGRESLEEELTPGDRDEALRLMSETRKLRAEKDEKAFESATAGIGNPSQPSPSEPSTGSEAKSSHTLEKSKKKTVHPSKTDLPGKPSAPPDGPAVKPEKAKAQKSPKAMKKTQSPTKPLP